MAGPRSPWSPIDMDVADKTARITTLEVQYNHVIKSLDKQSQQISDLDTKFDKLSDTIMDRKLTEMAKIHDKELENIRQTSEVTSKVKLLWAGGGVLITALLGIIGMIIKYRFGG